MARRRGRSSRPPGREQPKQVSRRDAMIRAPVTHEDLGLDEEETWHKDQDKVLLEVDAADAGSEDEDEEVFALKGVGGDSEDEGEVDESDDEDDLSDDADAQPTPATKSKRPAKQPRAASVSTGDSESESEEEAWGTKKSAYYSTPGDVVDSSDEEARALQVAEAKRLQRRGREALDESDFGLGNLEDDEPPEMEVDETIPAPAKPALPHDKAELIRHLERTSPETLALAREWTDIAFRLEAIKGDIERFDKEGDPDLLGLMQAHYQTLLTYAATLAFYLHLRAKPENAVQANSLSTHPILPRLLELKRHLSTMEMYGFAADDEDEKIGSGSEDGSDAHGEHLWETQRRKGLEDDELEELLRDAVGTNDDASIDVDTLLGLHTLSPKRPSVGANGKSTSLKIKGQSNATTNGVEKKKAKPKAKAPKKTAPVSDLVQPEFTPASRASTSARQAAFGDDDAAHYGDPTALSTADASDKSARKRSLRFHTSRIEGAAARREAARKGREGGDEDIPYKSRRRDVQAKAAAKPSNDGADAIGLDEEEWGEADRKRARDVMDEDDYDAVYDLVSREKKRRKVEKKNAYEAEKAAERVEPTEPSSTGPRSLTRAILTNRGLTPRRSKLARNPRVKKRVRFDKAQKRLSSQKAVFKGGQASLGGEYGGEKSGISKSIIKSVRL